VTKWSALSFGIGVSIVFAAGCASVSDRVVLLPNADGRTSAVVVTTQKGETILSSPYTAVEVKGGKLITRASSEDEVRSRYRALLEAQPPRPLSFVIYFPFASAELTAESKALPAHVKNEIASMPVAEIVLIGHTDAVGPEGVNDPLSVKRAEVVRDALVAAGISARAIKVEGRGKRELAVPTRAEVPEPKNRRVEIRIR
jgi:outer membrane protein OmpA-like peptidoglycan-associated protein